MQLKMDGRGAIITGGSLGIGRAIATRFAEAGGNVAIIARRDTVLAEAKKAIEKAGGGKTKVVAISADISKPEDCRHVFMRAETELGHIDVLVNNAGSSKRGPFLEHSDEVWQADLDLKLFAAIRLTRLALPGMRKRKWGRIINILNTGSKAPPAEGSPTAVSRAAGLALTKVLAGENAPFNVLVNALLVGKIESDQWVRRATSQNIPLSEVYADMGKSIPLGRVGTAQEFANVACFLASDAGSYVTGAAINVDGGLCPVA